ncbi:MAG TPA: extracellular solute-binding protein [Xanthobacteraceae bacterium]|nr:extracellular solute-binding protein [Xanthobacteraceae bacterium]
MLRLTRRRVLEAAAGAAVAGVTRDAVSSAAAASAAAADAIETHGLSAFGDLAYPVDFQHFRYVDPKAPKGGVFSQIGPNQLYNQNFLTFNSLNSFILKGDAAQGMELTFATLLAPSGDEPDAMYGLAADKVRRSADGLTYTFFIRPEARFHDGSPLTAHDVEYSLTILKAQGHPLITQLLRDMLGAKADDDRSVTVTFAPKRARDVPLFVAGLPIFSRAYYAKRKFDESTLDPPLGSGAYRVGRFDAGRYIEYDRVKDWWGADLPVSRGQNNFDTLRFEYYRDREVGFEGFTAKSYLFREEFTSRTWKTRYNFPAARDGRVKTDTIPDDTPSGAQGWFINTRRKKFADRRLREALNNAFDFEWTNKTIMYGCYERTISVFQNSDMMAKGKPSAAELKLLEPLRGRVADEVFGEPYVPPVTDGSGNDRAILRKAVDLLAAAGCAVKDGKRVLPSGEPITIEFLLNEPTFEPHHLALIKNLATLGIAANIRLVDPVQYRARLDDFDFDITVERLSFSATPGDSLRSYFSSQAAALNGSNNLAGIADPVVDGLIESVIAADSRPALVTACRALDRVIRAGRYWIPQWYKATHWIAYWDVFDRPPAQPRYFRGIPDTWWYDPAKAAKLEQKG